MSKTAFARKYRPLQFSEVIGQAHIARLLENAINQGRIASAYLFTGPRGTGKTTFARILARSLNCEAGSGPSAISCGVCDSCRSITLGNSLDVQEIDGATNNGVEAVKQIISTVSTTAARARYKIYTIDEVHMLSTAAFNALLKTLEEPPEHVRFIFATTEPSEIPATVISRCQRLDLRPITNKDIVSALTGIASKEGIDIGEEAMGYIARAAKGGLRDATMMLDQMASMEGGTVTAAKAMFVLGVPSVDEVIAFGKSISYGDVDFAMSLISRGEARGVDPGVFCAEMSDFFRACAIRRATGQHTAVTKEVSEKLEGEKLTDLMVHFGVAVKELRHSIDKRAVAEETIVLAAMIASRDRGQIEWERPKLPEAEDVPVDGFVPVPTVEAEKKPAPVQEAAVMEEEAVQKSKSEPPKESQSNQGELL